MSALDPASPLARALERGRERYNARITLARRQGLRLEWGALSFHLADALAPIVAAVEALDAARLDAVTDALFELSLDLVSREIVGPSSRQPRVGQAWRELLPALARSLVVAPQKTAAAITNAAYNLGLEKTARFDEWMHSMAAIAAAPGLTPDALLECGQVLAWRAGMAHWRESALAVWEKLPDSLARLTLGVAGETSRAALRAGLADPWNRPGEAGAKKAALKVVATLGGFRGFGGPFVSPPHVFVAEGRLWAADTERAFSLHADCFGQTLQRVSHPPAEEKQKAAVEIADDGTVGFSGLSARLPQLAQPSDFAATDGLLAVALARSHRILLVARTGGSA